MRRIDSWLGKPLAWILGWLTRAPMSLFGDVHPERPPERVICTKFIGLGSIVLSLPMLQALKGSGVKVAFWTFPSQAELARLSGSVDEVWVIRPTFREFLPTLWKTFRQARRFRAGAFIDLEPTAYFTALLARLSGAAIRIGFMAVKPRRERLFTHLVAVSPERHMIQNHLAMASLLGAAGPAALPALPTELRKAPAPDWAQAGAGGRPIIVNVNSSDLSWQRMWPDEHWLALCRQLLADPGTLLLFPGVGAEFARVQKLVHGLGMPERTVNLAGRTSLVELIALIRDSQLVVSVDSGIMHLAAWAGTPLVALFGPETPGLYGPLSPRSRAITAGLPCSPCLSVAAEKVTRCRDNQCMKRIAPDRVAWACRELLARAA